jgi:hypothetical protein
VGGYAEVWERFVRERRLEFGGHTDPGWRDGHALSASFMIPVEASHFRERLEPLRDALRPFPFVSLHPTPSPAQRSSRCTTTGCWKVCGMSCAQAAD